MMLDNVDQLMSGLEFQMAQDPVGHQESAGNSSVYKVVVARINHHCQYFLPVVHESRSRWRIIR